MTLKIVKTLKPGRRYCPVGHQNSEPPHSCCQSFVRYQMYATERAWSATESSCGNAYSPGLYHEAAAEPSPEQSRPERLLIKSRVAVLVNSRPHSLNAEPQSSIPSMTQLR